MAAHPTDQDYFWEWEITVIMHSMIEAVSGNQTMDMWIQTVTGELQRPAGFWSLWALGKCVSWDQHQIFWGCPVVLTQLLSKEHSLQEIQALRLGPVLTDGDLAAVSPLAWQSSLSRDLCMVSTGASSQGLAKRKANLPPAQSAERAELHPQVWRRGPAIPGWKHICMSSPSSARVGRKGGLGQPSPTVG